MNGLNCEPLILDKSVKGSTNKINKEPNIAITPNHIQILGYLREFTQDFTFKSL